MQKSPRSCPQGRLEEVIFTECIAVPFWPLVSLNDFGLSWRCQWEEVRPFNRFQFSSIFMHRHLDCAPTCIYPRD